MGTPEPARTAGSPAPGSVVSDHLTEEEGFRMAHPRYDHYAEVATSTVGRQVVLATYGAYADAERTVDYLSDNDFPVHRTAIVGRGLSSFEQVTGRVTAWRAATGSALPGTVLGAVFGWFFGLVNWIDPLISAGALALYGALFGLVVGGLTGLLLHALSGGGRDFSSISAMRADSYDVLVDREVAEQATYLLHRPSPVNHHRR
jgi:hypothetical protein